LAFYAARVALAAEALRPAQVVALDNGPLVADSDVIDAITAAPKPVRISGIVADAVLRIRLSSIASDPDAAKRFEYRIRDSGDQVPVLDPECPDQAPLLVVAFDKLLKVSAGTWREFSRGYWVEGMAWSGDWPTSGWTRHLRLPEVLLQDVRAVILVGYSRDGGLRSPFVWAAWSPIESEVAAYNAALKDRSGDPAA
jgi:hypothetical protein